MFLNPNNFSNLNSNCYLLDLRNIQERVKKAFCYQKLFWPFTVWINSLPSASNFKSFSRSTIFLTVGQNNFGNKIPFPQFLDDILWNWQWWCLHRRISIFSHISQHVGSWGIFSLCLCSAHSSEQSHCIYKSSVEIFVTINPVWHDMWKQEKYSSLEPLEETFIRLNELGRVSK